MNSKWKRNNLPDYEKWRRWNAGWWPSGHWPVWQRVGTSAFILQRRLNRFITNNTDTSEHDDKDDGFLFLNPNNNMNHTSTAFGVKWYSNKRNDVKVVLFKTSWNSFGQWIFIIEIRTFLERSWSTEKTALFKSVWNKYMKYHNNLLIKSSFKFCNKMKKKRVSK